MDDSAKAELCCNGKEEYGREHQVSYANDIRFSIKIPFGILSKHIQILSNDESWLYNLTSEIFKAFPVHASQDFDAV